MGLETRWVRKINSWAIVEGSELKIDPNSLGWEGTRRRIEAFELSASSCSAVGKISVTASSAARILRLPWAHKRELLSTALMENTGAECASKL